MQMNHSEYLKVQEQLQDHFDGRYRKIEDCNDIVETEQNKIDKLQDVIADLKIEQTKTNTRLGVLIAILSSIAVAVLSVCVKLLFGS